MSLVVRRRSLVPGVGKNRQPSFLADGQRASVLFRSRLAHFLLQALACVTHTFILVRIGWTKATHFSGNLSDFLAIDSGDAPWSASDRLSLQCQQAADTRSNAKNPG